MAPQHILIISYVFPPFKGIGGRRWGKFAKYLARRGHTIHVLHCAPEGKDLGSPWKDDVVHERIHTYAINKRYPAVLSKRPLTSIWDKITYRYWQRKLARQVKGNYYDKCVFWERDLLSRSTELISKHGIRNIIVTGAPFRLLYFASKLKRPDNRIIGDFRDPWTWADVYGYANLSDERMQYELKMERTVVQHFDKILSPAPAILEHLKNAYPETAENKFVRVAHAFDKDDVKEGSGPKVTDGSIRFVYAGSMYGAAEAEAYFRNLISALSSIRNSDPVLLTGFRFDLYITGHGTTQYESMTENAGMQDLVRFHAPKSSSEIFSELMASDYVLIFIPSINRHFMGTKFSEIFALGVPVLHVGPQGYVSQFIETHKTGYSFRVKELETKLRWVLKERPQPETDRDLIMDMFDIERITDRLENEVLLA